VSSSVYDTALHLPFLAVYDTALQSVYDTALEECLQDGTQKVYQKFKGLPVGKVYQKNKTVRLTSGPIACFFKPKAKPSKRTQRGSAAGCSMEGVNDNPLTGERQSVMESQTEFQREAQQKWPTAKIHGDGQYALVCPGSYSVTLYTFWMGAMADLARDHGNWRCKDQHRLVEIDAAPRRAPLTIRNRAALERDR
jgi:hypothetical protein